VVSPTAPGIAVPFFVAHPRLRELERRMMGDVEGGNRLWRSRILRHEAGHALDTAYGLRRRADWRRTFGRASAPYPKDYSPRPTSQGHVLHLGHWYAQSHATEDFAETFAVWLQPKASWRRDYADWPALAKLEYVDRVIDEVCRAPPRVRDRSVIEPLASTHRTPSSTTAQTRARASEHRYDACCCALHEGQADCARPCRSSERSNRTVPPRAARACTLTSSITPSRRSLRVRRSIRLRFSDNKRSVVRLHERVVLDVLRRNRENYAL
jgi:hypothetical protein